MIVYQYDKSFDGLLTCIFEAYDRKMFPDILQAEGVPLPLFHEEVIRIITDERKSSRVWKGLEKRLSPAGLSVITSCWLSELPDTDRLLFRYIRKAIDALRPIEINFGDPVRSLRKWGTNVYGLSNSPVFKKPSTELILPPSNRYTMYCLWLSVTFKTDSPTNAGCCMISNGNTVIITIGKKSMKSVSKPKEPIF